MTDKPHFIARKFQEAQRLGPKGYICPLCDERFQAEPKLWAHAKGQHQQDLHAAGDTDEAELRKKFRHEATEKTQKILRKTTHDAAPATSKLSSNDNDSTKPNIGDDVRSRSAQGSSPIPGSTHNFEKRIDDIAKLTLGQGHIEAPSYESPRSPSSLYNPLKRGVGDDVGHIGEDTRDSLRSRARRTKAKSGGPYISQDSDINRVRAATDYPGISRDTVGPGKRLFNPEVDNPVSGAARKSPDRAPGVNSPDDPLAKVAHIREVQPANLYGQTQLGPFQDYRMKPQPFQIIKANHGADDHMDLDQLGITGEASPTTAAQTEDLEPDQETDPEPVLLLQPETRPISHDQLVVEVKGIYAGLVLVERKCIVVDEEQSKAAQEEDPSRQTRLTHEQWQALIHLHKTLLHEHHDFFLASQHPSASPALSKLAARYFMPARMWRHGIHAFLEVLRQRLPESLDHMLAFIYIAYSMMALLYETVSTFENTWIECLGDLGRYRMAIEDEDPRDRDVWSGVARYWYSKAADKIPANGRLYHHLAILARPYTLQQLSFYAQSLTSIEPFNEARSSIMTLFDPILNGKESAYHRSTSMETVFIKAHGLLFCGRPPDQFNTAVRQLEEGLMDNYIGRITLKFREQGVSATVANISALFEYGLEKPKDVPRSVFRLAYDETQRRRYDGAKRTFQASRAKGHDVNDTIYKTSHPGHPASIPQQPTLENLTTSELETSQATITCASRLTFSTLSISLQRPGDKNVWPLVHVSLVFVWSLTIVDKAMAYVERDVPWSQLCSFLNHLARLEVITATVVAGAFPQPKGVGRPLPEDFVIHGQVYSQWYFPDGWFKETTVDDEECTQDPPSLAAPRAERILWLGMRIASSKRWIAYDEGSKTFKLATYATEGLDASVQMSQKAEGGTELWKDIPASVVHKQRLVDHGIIGSSSKSESAAQQHSTLSAKSKEPSAQSIALQKNLRGSYVTPDIHDTSAIETHPTESENPHTLSWLKGSIVNRAEGPPPKGILAGFETSLELGQREALDNDGQNGLSTH